MEIKGLKIGEEHPTRIIAELGTLHLHQSKDEILEIIGQCFVAGADLVKLQLINPDAAWWAGEQAQIRYRSLFKSWSIPSLNDLMRSANKRFEKPVFASIFDPLFFNVDMPAVKLGYKAYYMPWLVIDTLNHHVPTIISADFRTRELLPSNPDTKFLWVDPTYPMQIDSYSLSTGALSKFMPLIDHREWHGYSLHTKDLDFIFRVCEKSRPEILELHVMGEEASGPDTSFALTLDELREVSTGIRVFNVDESFS